MWLINTTDFKLEWFASSSDARYAILSHTWSTEEVLFEDILSLDRAVTASETGSFSLHRVRDPTKLKGWRKIEATCRHARHDGLPYAWIDTCCIDKRSIAEISEAITSVYQWYSDARACYAYLSDAVVPDMGSIWVTRGWTLQELLAPTKLRFYDRDWNVIGERVDLANEICTRTGIDINALTFSRMSGAGAASQSACPGPREEQQRA